MKRQVIWSPASRAELIRIARAVALDNPSAARIVTAKLRVAGESLGDKLTGRPGRVSGTREKVVPKLPYITVYELIPEDTEEAVAILHVIHTRRNWPAEDWPDDQSKAKATLARISAPKRSCASRTNVPPSLL